jgi:uncharacterized protein (TIGR03790 family)
VRSKAITSLLLSLVLFGCSPSPDPPVVADPRASEVLVVWNANAPESRTLAETYIEKRGVPRSHLVTLKVPTTDNIARTDYLTDIRDPVRNAIGKLKEKINFIVLIRGVPIRLDNDQGYSVDACLMLDAHPARKTKPFESMPMPKVSEDGKVDLDESQIRKVLNPYGGTAEAFDSSKYGFYLCTRLDGYTVEDAMGLIQRSLKAAPEKGLFLLDASPGKTGGGYALTQGLMPKAKQLLEAKQLIVELDDKESFVGGRSDLMGYASWGSNDGSFRQGAYNTLSFRPGAIAETFVSTSGRTFRPTAGGQSLIADLIHQGVTGVKGYVSEPFTFALAHVDVLFDRYTSGFNLAESFYMASPMLKWKDIVIGDPLCCPYKKPTAPSPGG